MTGVQGWWAGGRHVTLPVAGRDRRIFVRDEGSGPPLVLLHGYPGSSFEWAGVWPALAAAHRVVALDLLGFGASDKPARHRYRLAEQADLVEALLRELEIGAFSVLAYDYGTIVVQELLARGVLPERVVLSNTGLFPDLYRPRRVQKLSVAPVVGTLLAALAANERTFRETWSAVYSREHPLDPVQAAQHWQALRAGGPGRTLQRRLLDYIPERRAAGARYAAAIQDNSARLSFLWGLQDPVSGSAIAAALPERLTDPDLVTYPDAGHCPHIEIPDRFAADVLARTAPDRSR
ncbi:alpha/beta fold hydrolase [Actinomadura rugatobispora]|uniref:Alpha/beta fold hydrolase n=1 Tax=Actinomadura rugatobispora TaxID=1994 RepID=A0ABW1A782_9ACTN|nr:alpha/beta hydrolase [Actinomadura rugatobispora]